MLREMYERLVDAVEYYRSGFYSFGHMLKLIARTLTADWKRSN